MQIYYFDMKDGATIRDRTGLKLWTNSQATAHCKMLARWLGSDNPTMNEKLCIVVLDAAGSEIHREQVYPHAIKLSPSLSAEMHPPFF